MYRISKLHTITHDAFEGQNLVEQVKALCEAGADWIQLRAKTTPVDELHEIAELCMSHCEFFGTTMIINDHVDIAKAIEADGVHLGKEDMDPIKAREILGDDYVIGGTANTQADIERLVCAKVNYIGLGPFRFTHTKKKLSPVLSLGDYRSTVELAGEIPVIAIGGVQASDIPSLMNIGVHGVAVSGAILNASNRAETVKEFMNQLNLKDHVKA